jgi:hypothetical protein
MKKLSGLFVFAAVLSLSQAAQAQNFKARLPNQKGEVQMLFRIYDQAQGGAVLSEETHTVQVVNGFMEATLAAPASNNANGILWVEMSDVASPDVVIGQRAILPPNSPSVNGIFLQPAAICYTCGGQWPMHQGTLPTPYAAYEYGPGCGGQLSSDWSDTTPYLCTKTDF